MSLVHSRLLFRGLSVRGVKARQGSRQGRLLTMLDKFDPPGRQVGVVTFGRRGLAGESVRVGAEIAEVVVVVTRDVDVCVSIRLWQTHSVQVTREASRLLQLEMSFLLRVFP